MASVTNTGKKPTFWCPRFSLRALVIFVTLVCCYFAAWEATKQRATRDDVCYDEKAMIYAVHSSLPLVIRRDEKDWRFSRDSAYIDTLNPKRRYYLWLFGSLVKVPYETSWKELDTERQRWEEAGAEWVRNPPPPARKIPLRQLLTTS